MIILDYLYYAEFKVIFYVLNYLLHFQSLEDDFENIKSRYSRTSICKFVQPYNN